MAIGGEEDSAEVTEALTLETCSGKDSPTEDMTIEVDGQWSFVIAFAAFISQVLLGGHVYTGGIYYTVFREAYPEVSTIVVSWLCTLPVTLWFCGSPVGSVIVNRFGCRTCALLGGILATTGLSLCYFATNFYMVFVFYGVVAGSGYGIQFVAYFTAMSRCFLKYRTMVTILTSIGTMGSLPIYSFLVPYLNSTYTWRGALLILGGISFNLCACACTLFPSSSRTVKSRPFSFSMMKNVYFVLVCFQCFFANLTMSMAMLHLPSLVLSFGFESSVVSLALSVYGICNCIGKLLYSVVGYVTDANVHYVYTISFLISGVAMSLTPVLHNVEWLLCFVGILGFTYCVAGGHIIIVILELTGTEKFSDGVGLNQLFKACGALISGPIAGMLCKSGGGYSTSFYTGGVLMFAGSLLLIPILLRKRGSLDIDDSVYARKHSVHVSCNDSCKAGGDLSNGLLDTPHDLTRQDRTSSA